MKFIIISLQIQLQTLLILSCFWILSMFYYFEFYNPIDNFINFWTDIIPNTDGESRLSMLAFYSMYYIMSYAPRATNYDMKEYRRHE